MNGVMDQHTGGGLKIRGPLFSSFKYRTLNILKL